MSCIEQVLEATSCKTAAVRSPNVHLKKHSKLEEPDMEDTAGEVKMNS